MKQFGIIGYPLSHSFSPGYFSAKFKTLGIEDASYLTYPLETIQQFPQLLSQVNPIGLNVTIPYKQAVIPYLDSLDSSAERCGAVNCIYFKNGKSKGYNTDHYGFKTSLETWLPKGEYSALVFGTGGASKAVQTALTDLGIPFVLVGREKKEEQTSYDELSFELCSKSLLWINTTPLGMSPNIDAKPKLPYDAISSEHYLYDLIYNPSPTAFMKQGIFRGARTKDGLEMLHLQAEKGWQIWNSD